MNLIVWLRKHRFDAKVGRVDTRLHDVQLHEVEKHAENLRLRSEEVERALIERHSRDPWGQAVAHIARKA